jgi:hypothetical protein
MDSDGNRTSVVTARVLRPLDSAGILGQIILPSPKTPRGSGCSSALPVTGIHFGNLSYSASLILYPLAHHFTRNIGYGRLVGGWHVFRRSYRLWLHKTRAPPTIQEELIHASFLIVTGPA